MSDDVAITGVTTKVYRFPTTEPESDGTLTWDATTAVTVTLEAGGRTGLGWTYSSPAAAAVIRDHLADVVSGSDAFDIRRGWEAMHRTVRNLGSRGLVMQALSAIDIAWWDLKARLLGVSLTRLTGAFRSEIPIYGSGGFTSLDANHLDQQIDWWHSVGCTAMKIKIGEGWGTNVERDLLRVRQLRDRAGSGMELMVDANGGYSLGQARRVGTILDDLGVTWFEEPVSSDDISGLATLKEALRCDVAAGEYAADSYEIKSLIPVVDCLQLDATRCGGYTGWLAGASAAQAHNLQVSAHCAPAIHAHIAAAVPNLRHVEWFSDHARLEPDLIEGLPEAAQGVLRLTSDHIGHGMSLNPGATASRID